MGRCCAVLYVAVLRAPTSTWPLGCGCSLPSTASLKALGLLACYWTGLLVILAWFSVSKEWISLQFPWSNYSCWLRGTKLVFRISFAGNIRANSRKGLGSAAWQRGGITSIESFPGRHLVWCWDRRGLARKAVCRPRLSLQARCCNWVLTLSQQREPSGIVQQPSSRCKHVCRRCVCISSP